MTEATRDQAYMDGRRMALLGVLNHVLRELGADSPEAGQARWASERTEALAVLRRICREHGDDDWPDDLHLADVLEKHLERHLDEPA